MGIGGIKLEIDRFLAAAGVIISTILGGYLFAEHLYLYSIVCLMVIIPSIVWLLFGSTVKLSDKYLPSSRSVFTGSHIFYLLGVISAIVTLYFRPDDYERPLMFFILIAMTAACIAIEIIYSPKKTIYISTIIVQIIILGVLISWSQLLIFPDVVGVDPWDHQKFVLDIVEYSHMPGNTQYEYMPSFHILIATTSICCLLNYKLASMASASFVLITFDIICIFLLGRLIYGADKPALFAALLLAIANYHIYRSFWMIPNSIAAIFILLLIYLLFSIFKKNKIGALLLIIIVIMALVTTHAMATLMMLIILTAIIGGAKIYPIIYPFNKNDPLTIGILIVFSVLMFSWWVYCSNHISILSYLIKDKFSMDIEAPLSVLEQAQQISFFEQFLHYLPEFLLFSLALIGCYYMLSTKGNSFGFRLAISGALIIMISFIAPLLQGWIIQDRWRFIGQMLLVIPAAYTITCISHYKSPKISSLVTFILICSITFLMVTSSWANMDNHLFQPDSGRRYAFQESELQAIHKVSYSWDGYIGTDRYPCSLQSMGYKVMDMSNQLYTRDFTDSRDIYILIRKDIINKPFWAFRTTFKLDYNPLNVLENQGFSNTYDCGSVNGFVGG